MTTDLETTDQPTPMTTVTCTTFECENAGSPITVPARNPVDCGGCGTELFTPPAPEPAPDQPDDEPAPDPEVPA